MTEITGPPFSVRRARTRDVPGIQGLVEPLVHERILLGKERVDLYEAVQEFRVAENADGELVGCGALHVMWEDLGEVRTLAAAADWRSKGVGHALLDAARGRCARARADPAVLPDLRGRVLHGARLRRARRGSRVAGRVRRAGAVADEGVAEFLDLARVKQNTLGNTRMLKQL